MYPWRQRIECTIFSIWWIQPHRSRTLPATWINPRQLQLNQQYILTYNIDIFGEVISIPGNEESSSYSEIFTVGSPSLTGGDSLELSVICLDTEMIRISAWDTYPLMVPLGRALIRDRALFLFREIVECVIQSFFSYLKNSSRRSKSDKYTSPNVH